MSFTIFTNGSLANADEVMANFYHIAQGDRLPRGGSSLAATTGVYDIGSTTYPWSAIYCDQIDYSGTLTTDKMWILVSELSISETATRIEFSGLNGEIDEIYKIQLKAFSNLNILLNINGDSSATYKTRAISYEKLKDIDISAVTTSFILHHDLYGVNGAKIDSEILISCDAGYGKIIIADYHEGVVGATFDGTDFGQIVGTSGITGTLTSIQIIITNALAQSITSSVKLYRAKNV